MEWLQLSLNTSQDNADGLSDLLTDAGAVSITFANNAAPAIYQADTEQKDLWQNTEVVALFPADYNKNELHDKVDLTKAKWQTVAEQDWLHKWQEHLEPMQFGDRLWVCPSWCTIPDPKAINVILDPEMAFGTGSHPTTALCLEWIANNVKAENTILDFGCGSGILAIAAAKLGASEVYAIDIDPEAITVCQSNASKNNVSINTELPNTKVDIVVANILAKPLIELAPTLSNLVKDGGTLVLSGILFEQADTIMLRYSEWFGDFTVQQQGEWILISSKCP